MSKRIRWSGWVASAALLIFTYAAAADEPKWSLPSGKQVPESASEQALERVLQDWQQAQSKIDRLDARFSYILYDDVFRAANIGRGLVSVDRDGRTFLKLEPDTWPAESKTVKAGGTTYTKVRAPNERWHVTEHSLIKVDDVARRYERIALTAEDRPRTRRRTRDDNPSPAPPPLPEDVSRPKSVRQPEKILLVSSPPALPEEPAKIPAHTPTLFDVPSVVLLCVTVSSLTPREAWSHIWTLDFIERSYGRPFLLDPQPHKLRSRYSIALTKQSDKAVWLEFRPKVQPEISQFQRIHLMLDRSNYNPMALKIVGSTGDRAQVYVFSDVRINQRPTDPFGDLGEPDLKGYKRLFQPE